MTHRTWIMISGLIWAAAGVLLLYKGFHILSALPDASSASWWIAPALFIGFLKGRFVLAKTVHRIAKRIFTLKPPIQFIEVYPKSYWILLSCMMGLGLILRLAPPFWHGLIDVGVGSALINGSVLYFRITREAVSSV